VSEEIDDSGSALQSALAAEHAAVYAYGVIGGVLGATSAEANSAYAAHRGRRDQLMARIGSDAVAAQPAYELPFPVRNAAQAQRLAVHVEQRCAEVYADVVSRTAGAARMYAARGLTECTVRGMTWGGDFEAFPGLRGRSGV
jgi:Domain of unknown function (DUF4439)